MSLTIGLERNSPIPIESDPRKFEGLIVRHGQWVRWSVARKCTCVLDTNRPDPRCAVCRGKGWRYSFQLEEENIEEECQAVDATTVDAKIPLQPGSVRSARLGDGRELQIVSVLGRWIKVSGIPLSGRETVYVTYSTPRAKEVPDGKAYYAGHGVVAFDDEEYQGPWARVPYDLVEISSVKRLDGTVLEVKSFSVEKVEIDISIVEPAIGERLSVAAKYMPPYRIAVLGQNISEQDRNSLREIGGDAIAVFPFAYKIAEMDLLTLWSGAQVRKRIIRKAVGDTDDLPDLFVSKILSLSDKEKTYTEGVHFVLWDRNTIRWIVDEGQRPDENKYYAIEYMANMTYTVLPGLPNIRSSEDKRFPSRVALKLTVGITGGDPL